MRLIVCENGSLMYLYAVRFSMSGARDGVLAMAEQMSWGFFLFLAESTNSRPRLYIRLFSPQ